MGDVQVWLWLLQMFGAAATASVTSDLESFSYTEDALMDF